MNDYRAIHQSIADKEQRAILLADATTEQWFQGANQKRWPVGSKFLWAIGVVGPKGSADKERVS